MAWDHLLDDARTGVFYLAQREIAALVKSHILGVSAAGLCALHSYVIMPNHVHLLGTPAIALPDLMQRIKGATALWANRLLGRSGRKFWQEEYFDRIVRNRTEFTRIQRYIEWNPVKAGLAATPEEFPWSSSWRG